MADQLQTTVEPSLASLVSGILADAQNLIKQQFSLVRTEIIGELRQARNAAISFGVGAGIAAAGAIFLLVMLVQLLKHYTDIPLWGCYGIVGGVCLALGGLFLYLGKREADDVYLLPPQQTAEAVKENLAWLQGQKTSEPK